MILNSLSFSAIILLDSILPLRLTFTLDFITSVLALIEPFIVYSPVWNSIEVSFASIEPNDTILLSFVLKINFPSL